MIWKEFWFWQNKCKKEVSASLLWSVWFLFSCLLLCLFCAIVMLFVPRDYLVYPLWLHYTAIKSWLWRFVGSAKRARQTLWIIHTLRNINRAFVPCAYADLAQTQLCLINPFQPIKKYFHSLWPSLQVPGLSLLCSVVTGIYAFTAEQLFISPNKQVMHD